MADAPAGRPISLRIDPVLLAAVDADLDGRTRTAWIEGAIRHRLAGGIEGCLAGIETIEAQVIDATVAALGPRKAPRGRTVPGLARSTADRLRRTR